MTVAGLVHRVEELLARGNALFGEAGPGGAPAWTPGADLTDAVTGLRAAGHQMAGQHGELAERYGVFAAGAGRTLQATAGTDTRLGQQVRAACRTQSAGRARSAAAVDGTRADVTASGTGSETPAGQRALIAALRARVAEQQRAIALCRARDARLAALLLTLGYGNLGADPGRIPLRGRMPGGARSATRRTASTALARGEPVMLAGSAHPATAPGMLPVVPGTSVGVPLGTLTSDSSPREVASAIIHEAHRRGYSPDQTTAILADALQESNLNPRAQSPNKLWYSIFQQDSSYPGRRDPNLAIAEFFNRLDRHGGAASPDIWKSIFWLQQRPGEASAQAAFAHGRQAYLQEIQRQTPRAVTMYRDIVDNWCADGVTR